MQPISTTKAEWFTPLDYDRPQAEADLEAATYARADALAGGADAETIAAHDRAIKAQEALLRVIDANLDKCGDAPPRFQIRAGSIWDRAEHRRRCNALAFYPSDLRVIEQARAIVKEAAAENGAALLGLLDEAQAATLTGDKLDDETAAALDALFKALEREPEFAELMAARRKYDEIAPLVALQMLVVGWENVRDEMGDAIAFARRGGHVPDDVLDLLPSDLLRAAGSAAYRRLYLPRSAEKNSRSPSSPRSSPPGSTAPTSTARAGGSSADTTADNPASSSRTDG